MLVDKPAGITSHDVVQQVRKAYGTRAAGHTGTLDPFATGLLVVLVGRATRLARFVEPQPKTYLATARLGFATDTDDATGTPTGPASDRMPSAAEIGAAVAGFAGRQRQRPPAYSAKHVAGERSYQLARRGAAIELAEVEVEVFGIEVVAVGGAEVTFRLTVSAGTYVRAIARDLGVRLGVGAHLTALRRERIGLLDVSDAALPAALGPGLPLRPAAEMLGHLPSFDVDDASAGAVGHGRAIPAPGDAAGTVALLREGRLIAVAEAAGALFQPRVVIEGS